MFDPGLGLGQVLNGLLRKSTHAFIGSSPLTHQQGKLSSGRKRIARLPDVGTDVSRVELDGVTAAGDGVWHSPWDISRTGSTVRTGHRGIEIRYYVHGITVFVALPYEYSMRGPARRISRIIITPPREGSYPGHIYPRSRSGFWDYRNRKYVFDIVTVICTVTASYEIKYASAVRSPYEY